MQRTPAKSPGKKAKKAPSWRELTDEQRWEKIYQGRAQKQASAPKSVKQAVGLALPGYVMHMAISDCHATFQATVRHDVHTAVVTSIAKVASLMPPYRREFMSKRLEDEYQTIRSNGFYLNNREFLYAVAHATVKLADDWRYPADSPACMAAIMLKEDAELDEVGDWKLDRKHALRMVQVAYNALTDTNLYGKPEEALKRLEGG